MNPPNSWFGQRYPSFEDLVVLAENLGCRVGRADLGDQALFICPETKEPPVILLPHEGGLVATWLLAHECGHLIHHSGPKTVLTYGRDEARADRWGACALIPEARIRLYKNASEDSFIGALSANYEDLPLEDCPIRSLAGKIARIRLQDMSNLVVNIADHQNQYPIQK